MCCYQREVRDRKKRERKNKERQNSLSESVFPSRNVWGKVVSRILHIQWRILIGIKNELESSRLIIPFIPTSKIPNALNFFERGFLPVTVYNCLKVWVVRQTIPNLPSEKYSLMLTILVLHLFFVW